MMHEMKLRNYGLIILEQDSRSFNVQFCMTIHESRSLMIKSDNERNIGLSPILSIILPIYLFRRKVATKKTRSDTRLPQSRAGGQGPYLWSLDQLGRSSEAKDGKNPKKVKWDGWTDQRTNGLTERVVESRSTRLKSCLKA